MKCFYHNDLDGQCAASWVSHFTENSDPDDFIEMHYGKEFPLETIQTWEEVYIVDFSIEPDVMRKLLNITDNVIWIDHHESAIRKYQDFKGKIQGIRCIGIAGCELTYMWFKWLEPEGLSTVTSYDPDESLLEMRDKIPEPTRLIGDRDVWQWKLFRTGLFFDGMQLEQAHPTAQVWQDLREYPCNNIDRICNVGVTVKKYKDQFNEARFNQYGFLIDWLGYNCACLNALRGSEIFAGVPCDIMIAFMFTGDHYDVSLYTEKPGINVAKICEAFGGGGHAGAAGFQCKELPFLGGVESWQSSNVPAIA